MGDVVLDITTSVDGYVAGPNPTLEQPLGERGFELHEWLFQLKSWRAQHGMDGGEEGDDSATVEAALSTVGAQVMGRRMFSGGSGPWEDDPNAASWFGDDPPLRVPVFVVTHHARELQDFANGTRYAFVEGVEAAVAQAREAAGDRDVRVAGGADVATQALRAGLLDRIDLHVAPVLLGSGTKLFADVEPRALELIGARASTRAAHVSYR
jgi:dihydrofolate reductase